MIYLDNAATSYPKPNYVLRETQKILAAPLGNPGRSGHRFSLAAAELVFSARESLARLLNLKKPERIVFCSGATAALNFAITGSVLAWERHRKKPLVVTDVLEHNSVLRPLYALEEQGRIRLEILSPESDGNLSVPLLMHLRPDLFVFGCRSNTTGHTFFIRQTVEALKKSGTVVIADASQALGSGLCTLHSTGAHMLCAPSHKGLLGIMGAGILAFSEDCPLEPEPILSGGSGIDSFSPHMPELLPEKMEAGTLPLPAIASMKAGADFLLQTGLETVLRTERERKKLLSDGIRSFKRYRIYEPQYPDGPLLVNRQGTDCQELAKALDQNGILARGGFHCAPLAHRFLGTEEQGALRFSPGFFTTRSQILETLDVLSRLEKYLP